MTHPFKKLIYLKTINVSGFDMICGVYDHIFNTI